MMQIYFANTKLKERTAKPRE